MPNRDAAQPDAASPARPKKERVRPTRRWRALLRGLHRDVGYFAVGLTLVYALSGLAVNHIADWDPNFRQIEQTHRLQRPVQLTADAADDVEADRRVARAVLQELGRDEEPQDVYRATDTQLEVVLEHSTLHVEATTGVVHEEGQRPRFLLRIANWLHLNRGKRAWTYVADAYAVFLLFLAGSGLFMLPGRSKGVGRRGLLVTGGFLVPVVYVVLSGGP